MRLMTKSLIAVVAILQFTTPDARVKLKGWYPAL
jgi:hypothetical protein